MTKGSSLILRLYFAVVSAVTLFTLMFGLIDLLSIGLKTYVFKSADVPTYGLESCENPGSRDAYYGKTVPTPAVEGTVAQPTAEELKAACELRRIDAIENYQREKANQAVRNLALIIVSLPLFLLHFKVVYRDWAEERKA